METVYGFEISNGDVWRLSKKTITVNSKSDLKTRMKPVYLNNTLHWLRNDESIIAFNTETEQARFIPSIFHPEPEMKMLFTPDDEMNLLALISGTKEKILVYTLLDNTKWTLAREIKNVYMEESELDYWNVVAYDGKLLVLSEKKERNLMLDGVIHAYDMKANSWGVLGSTIYLSSRALDFFKFTPFFFSIEEDEKKKNLILPSNDPRISSLTAENTLGMNPTGCGYFDPTVASSSAHKISNRHRWTPTSMQLQILESIYEEGSGTPNPQRIRAITTELSQHGQIIEKNVYILFQNRRARSKRKQPQTTTTVQAVDAAVTTEERSFEDSGGFESYDHILFPSPDLGIEHLLEGGNFSES